MAFKSPLAAACLLACLAAFFMTPPLQAQDSGGMRHRIVSLNLCTDGLLLELADPADILGLSPLAADCAESPRCADAKFHALQRPDGEGLLVARPDLVLDGAWGHPTVGMIARALRVPLLRLPPADKLSDIPSQLRTVGHAIGQSARGEAEAQAFERRLATLQPRQTDRPPTVIVIGANLSGEAGGLMRDMLRHAGFRLAAEENADGSIPLEMLISHPPDLLVTDMIAEGVSLAESVVRHPALEGHFSGVHRVALPGRLTLCGLPETLDALGMLIAAHDRLAAESAP